MSSASPSLMQRMRERYGVDTWGVIAILLTFTLTGLAIVRVTGPVLGLFVSDEAPRWLKWTLKVVIIFPLYQVILLAIGSLLGQWRFFWEKEKLIMRLLSRPFRRRPSEPSD